MDDNELLDRVRLLVRDAGDVIEKRMFGSIGFMINATMRLAVGTKPDRVMMVRVAPEERADCLARDGAQPAIMQGRTMRNYLFLADAAVVEDDDLCHWVAVALRAPDSSAR